MSFKRSNKLTSLVEDIEAAEGYDDLDELADATCTAGYDNDGSTGFEIFENGFDLCKAADGQDVYAVRGDGTYFFFIGDEGRIEYELKNILSNLEEDEDDEEE